MQLVLICKENHNNIDNVVQDKVTNFGIKQNVEDLLKLLKALSVAVDKIQENNYMIAAAVHIWEILEKDLMDEKLVKMCMKIFSHHYNHTLSSPYVLGYLMDPH